MTVLNCFAEFSVPLFSFCAFRMFKFAPHPSFKILAFKKLFVNYSFAPIDVIQWHARETLTHAPVKL